MTRFVNKGGLVFLASLALPAILLLTGGPHVLKGFPLDDAWIHMVYGRSIAAGGFPAYNAGIPATGSTSPLWAYIIGLIHLLSSKPAIIVLGVKGVGIACHGFSAWALYRIVKKLSSSNSVGLICGMILGFSPALAASSISGMEISLGCAVCLWGIERYSEKRFLAAGIMFGLAGLTRPEYAIVIIVLLGDLLVSVLRKEVPWKRMFELVAPIAIAGGLFLGWDLFVDGRPFPATFYVKTRPLSDFPLFDRVYFAFHILTRDAPLAGWVAWSGLIGGLFMGKQGKRQLFLFLVSASLFTLAQIVMIAPADPWSFYHIRYLLPVVPLFWISLAAGVWAGFSFLWRSKADSGGFPWKKALGLGYLVVTLMITFVNLARGNINWSAKFENDCRNIDEVQVELGRAIDRGFPQNAVVGTVDAGAIKYFGKRKTIDLIGLNTPDVLRDMAVRLDAVVLMPAWIKLPEDHGLEIVGMRETKDYQVTSNPRMDHQVIMVCRGEGSSLLTPIKLLASMINIRLNCMASDRIELLKAQFKYNSFER